MNFSPLSFATRLRVSLAGKRKTDFWRKVYAFILIICALALLSCAKGPSAELEKGLSFYRQNQLEEALPFFERAVEQDKNNPDAYAWLAETYRRLGQIDSALENAQNAIKIDTCHSFAHTVLADLYNPMYGLWEGADEDSAWHHLLRAIECDSTDGDAWLGVWTEAIRHKEWDLEKKALHAFIHTGILTPAILSYNRWMLQHVPDNGILLTNGDMDTYPAVALQQVENYRPDVAIVNYSLLNTTWYARFVRDKYGIQLPFTDTELDALRAYKDESGNLITVANQIMQGWLKMRKSGDLKRPIAISVTVGDLSFAKDTQDHLSFAGAFRLWLPEPAESPQDTSMMRKSLASINPDDFTGPFASAKDRSSVRIASSNRVATNITQLALTYSDALIQSGRALEASEMLEWAEQFERKTELGPVLTDQIEKLKEEALKMTE